MTDDGNIIWVRKRGDGEHSIEEEEEECCPKGEAPIITL
jgi:hypothetical protein